MLSLIFFVSVMFLTLIFSVCSSFSNLEMAGAQQGPQSTNQSSTTTSKFVSYNGTKYGAIIHYPQSWKTNEDANGVWFVSPVDETGNVRIESLKAINGSLPLTVQTQLMLSKTTYKELSIVSTNMTTLDGLPANRTDYKFKVEIPRFLGSDIFDYTAFQISALKGDRVYTFTYFSTPENFHLFLPIVQKMLDSVKIL